MLRHNHYDAAFEAFLRRRRLPYVAVDETQRALLADGSLKSPDFLVYGGPESPAADETGSGIPFFGNWVVDVKGRRWETTRGKGRAWENWATADDISSLSQWQGVFGDHFRAALVFAYDVSDARFPQAESLQAAEGFEFRGRRYRFFGVWVDDYRREMKPRSPRWETVWLPAEAYRRLRFPLTTSVSSRSQSDPCRN